MTIPSPATTTMMVGMISQSSGRPTVSGLSGKFRGSISGGAETDLSRVSMDGTAALPDLGRLSGLCPESTVVLQASGRSVA